MRKSYTKMKIFFESLISASKYKGLIEMETRIANGMHFQPKLSFRNLFLIQLMEWFKEYLKAVGINLRGLK
jgi:hypothetical protein